MNNTCQCSSLYHGLKCELLKLSCFGKQDDSLPCSGNGLCIAVDTCQCNDSYVGSRCFASISQPKYNIISNILEFQVNYTSIVPNNSALECRKVIKEISLSILGTDPSCFWRDGNFYIGLGDQHSLTPFSNITLNVNALDSDLLSSYYLDFTVTPFLNPVQPVVIISYKKSVSPCEEILIDASRSFSDDLNPVQFIWSIELTPDSSLSLEKLLFDDSKSSLKSNNTSVSGKYVFGLIVQSSLSGLKSEKQLIEITKSSIPQPTLALLTSKMSLINIRKSSLPLVVKKSIELPTCYFERKEFNYIWEQVSGSNTIDYHVDINNDLVITGMSNNQDEAYTFSVKAISKFNPNSNATLIIPISSKLSDLSLNVYLSTLSTNQADIIAEYSDPDNGVLPSFWNWTCFDRNMNQSCIDFSLSNMLNQCSNSKSTVCTIHSLLPKITLTLLVQQGKRAVFKAMDIDFPNTELLVSPVVNLISVNPNRVKVLRDELLSLQLNVLLGGEEKNTNDDYMMREWKINGNSLTSSLISKMAVDPAKSSSLILSLSSLVEDMEYEILFKVTDRRNNRSSQFSYKFKLVKSPKSCICNVSPSYGYALETEFSFKCPGCQNIEKSLDFVFGFIDDKSGTKLPLYNLGETFASRLPSPYYSNQMDIFVDIVDMETGASVEIIQKVEIYTPTISSLSQVKIKSKSWKSYAASLLPSDSAKLVFNSATISRTSELMIAQLSKERNKHSVTVPYELREDMIDSMTSGLEQKNPLELISDIHFRVFIFGLESIISNCESVESLPFDKFYNLTERIINMANQNSNFRVSFGADKMCNSLFDNIIRLLTSSGEEFTNNYRYRVLDCIKIFTHILLRSYNVGQKNYQVHLPHISTTSLLSYKSQLFQKTLSPDQNSTVVISKIDSNLSSRSVIETAYFSFVDFMGVSNYLDQLAFSQNYQVSEVELIELNQSFKLLTKIVSLDKKNGVDALFIFNIGNNYNFSNINVNNYFESSIRTFQQSTNIITKVECVPIDNLFRKSSLDCSTIISNSLIYCNCSLDVKILVVIEKTVETKITRSKAKPNSFSFELYGLFGLFGLLGVCCCVLIFSVTISLLFKFNCLGRKKNLPEIATQNSIELMTV